LLLHLVRRSPHPFGNIKPLLKYILPKKNIHHLKEKKETSTYAIERRKHNPKQTRKKKKLKKRPKYLNQEKETNKIKAYQ
jgi:hypothetical protein